MTGINQNGIAIIGLSGRFPGAGNADDFWRNLIAGVESISTFSDEELAAAGNPARKPDPEHAGTLH
jgi:acyl transferase domain-containing protein